MKRKQLSSCSNVDHIWKTRAHGRNDTNAAAVPYADVPGAAPHTSKDGGTNGKWAQRTSLRPFLRGGLRDTHMGVPPGVFLRHSCCCLARIGHCFSWPWLTRNQCIHLSVGTAPSVTPLLQECIKTCIFLIDFKTFPVPPRVSQCHSCPISPARPPPPLLPCSTFPGYGPTRPPVPPASSLSVPTHHYVPEVAVPGTVLGTFT